MIKEFAISAKLHYNVTIFAVFVCSVEFHYIWLACEMLHVFYTDLQVKFLPSCGFLCAEIGDAELTSAQFILEGEERGEVTEGRPKDCSNFCGGPFSTERN